MAVGNPAGQVRRRALYGLNVAVALAAAVAVVVLINLLVDWQYRRLDPSIREWARVDLSAGATQTLSPQTRKVLGSLDHDVELIALMRIDARPKQELDDLLGEYARYSNRLTYEAIHPDRERERLDAVFERAAERYADQTTELRGAVGAGLGAVKAESGRLGDMADRFRELARHDGIDSEQLRDALRVLGVRLGETRDNYEEAHGKLAASFETPLPPLSAIRHDLANALRTLDTQVLEPYLQLFQRFERRRSLPMAVRNGLIELDGEVRAMRQRVRPMIDTLTAPAGSAGYDRMVASLNVGEVVLLWSGDGARALPLAELYVAETGGEDDTAGARLIGEERLTGALVTMGMPRPPRVVFVRDTPVSAVGERGGYRVVASRLAGNGFEIAEWPLGEGGGAPPTPAAGQRVVWVVPPLDPQRTTAAQREQLADALDRRLSAGDGVWLGFAYDPEALYRPADALADLAAGWGLDVQRQRVLLREGLDERGLTRAVTSVTVDAWPASSPLRHALAGRLARLALVSPVAVDPAAGVTAEPLVTLEHERQWIGEELADAAAIRASRYEASTAAGEVVAVAAAERDAGGRLVASGAPHWPTDTMAGTAPGNAELFVNSVYWLARLDDAIAATPRSQSLRRVGPMSDAARFTSRLLLLAGLPVVALLAGAVVWAVRRRG